MERPTEVQLELETGVTQARLAEIAEVSPSTLRGYEKEGLISLLSNDGKKLYGPASLTDLMRVKMLKAEGFETRGDSSAPSTRSQIRGRTSSGVRVGPG